MKRRTKPVGLTQDEIKAIKELVAQQYTVKAVKAPSRRRIVLSDEQVAEMRKRYEAGGTTIQDLATEYGIAASYTWRILKRKVRV